MGMCTLKKWFVVGILMALPGLLLASRTEAAIFTDKGYHDYEGTIGTDLKIQMSIYPDGERIVGSYFYEKYRQEIELKGTIQGNSIVLYEYAGGAATGVFEGKMSTVDAIEGTWRNLKNGKQHALRLRLRSIISGEEYGHRYRLPGWENDEDLERFVRELQGYVINGQKEKVASLILYPISVWIDGARLKVTDSGQFIKYYDKVFNPSFKRTISNAFTKYLFVNWQGVMFGGNEQNIWLSYVREFDGGNWRPMIIGINNEDRGGPGH